ncbi:MAG: hypothetical protein IT324_20215 [Anaerolineae bacterium]|nr:hypothetical protein [Anaerolineae bacterium]
MRPQRLLALILLLVMTACTSSTLQNPINLTSMPTPGALTKTVYFWDLGVSMKYPENWVAPQFNAGQVVVVSSPDAIRNRIVAQPIVALRIVDPLRELGLAKNATLDQIARAAGASSSTARVTPGGNTSVAGQDAAYVNVSEDSVKLNSLSLAFRMPDGRVGVLIGVAPKDQWGDFAPTLENMRVSIALLKPTDFPLPEMGSDVRTYPQGGITFNTPKGWIDKDLGSNTRQYRDPALADYPDGSGYVNGPQLFAFGVPLPPGAALDAVLKPFVNARANDPVKSTTVGGQPALEILITNATTGQTVNYTGFASQDKTVLIVFRWTTPAILTDALRPTFESILKSVTFNAITATLIVAPTRPASATRAATP